jgi:hypothetical protein
MQWSNGKPFVPPNFLDRLWLRRAELRYTAHGWPVLPGACPAGEHCAGGPIMECHPAAESSADGGRAAAWWRRSDPVLLATGGKFDVLEVPAAVGLRALGAARLHADVLGLVRADDHGPVAVGPAGRWMFFVRPGAPLRPELDNRLDVLRRGRGSSVPAAPSRLPGGIVRWAVSPDQVHWRLPDSAAVQAMLVDAISALGRRPAREHAAQPAAVPRQLSTARRAL